MDLIMLKSKLHRARVTESLLEYEGSLAVDQDLLDAVKIRPYEKIMVSVLENGNRFETYAIPAKRGSGTIGLNGPTSHMASVGNHLVVFAFALVPEREVPAHKPMILILDEKNRPVGGLKQV
jgi:aspartate 1-decarboxylase